MKRARKMSNFIFCLIIFIIVWEASSAVEETDNFATSDVIRIKSVTWENSTIGTLFFIEYESLEKPQIVWGDLEYENPHDAFPLPVPFVENQENWINTFSQPNGLLIMHIPHTLPVIYETRYLFIGFITGSVTLQIQINRIWCEKRGQNGKQMTANDAVTMKPFGNTSTKMKNVIIHVESKSMVYDLETVFCTVNEGHNISSTVIRPDHPIYSKRKENIYVNSVNVEDIPLNSILSIRYKIFDKIERTGAISSYRYQHRMVIRNPNLQENAVSVLISSTNTEPSIPLKTTGLIKCVAFGFPRPSIYFFKGSKRLEPNHKYDVIFDFVTISYLEIPDFSLADRGNYRCSAQSESSISSIDIKVHHSTHVSKDKTKVMTLTKDKVEVVCVVHGDKELKVSFIIGYKSYGGDDKSFTLTNNKTISVGNVTSDVFITKSSTSSTRTANLIILNPNVQKLSSILCKAEDSYDNDIHTVLKMRELDYITAKFTYTSSHMTTVRCSTTEYWPEGEDMLDIITMEWYKNKIKPENKINPDANTVIVTQNNNKYNTPTSYLILLNKRYLKSLDFNIICRAYTRFKEYSAVAE